MPRHLHLAPSASILLPAVLALAGPARAQFGPEHLIDASGPTVVWVHPADLDGDGDQDVLVCRNGAPVLTWHANDGGGAFGPAQPLPIQPFSGMQVLTMDLEGDGDQDVLTVVDFYTPSLGTDIQCWRLVNDGSGSFTGHSWFGFGSSLELVTLGDLEGDGDLDVFAVDWSPGRVTVIPNLGGGSFGASQLVTDQVVGPRDVAAADLDGDGDADLIAALYALDEIAWYENPGAGPFGPKQVLNAQADGALAVHAADLDGDGDNDVLSASTEGFDKEVHFYRNLGGGTFAAPVVIATEGYPGLGVSAADLDGDRDADVLATESFGAAWYANDGSGAFGPRQVIQDQATGRRVEVADLNGDRAPDVLIGGGTRVAWFENEVVGPLGASYCGPAVVNSSGQSGVIRAAGSLFVGVNDVELAAEGLPPNQFGIFLTSRLPGLTPGLGGGAGTLCLSLPIQRLLPIQSSGPAGAFTLQLDLPSTLGAPVLPGETWYFQAWHRDVVGVSNLTQGLRIEFAP